MSLAAIGTLTGGVLQLHPALTIPTLDGKRLRDETLPDSLSVDASHLQHADSIGVAALVWLAALAGAQNKNLAWQNLPPVLNELLALYEIDLPTMSQPCKKN
jgi:hypothetical protein